MGMPINSFEIIYTLVKHDLSDWKYKQILKAISQFNVYAFIIHDPEIHKEFDKKLNNIFEQLDAQTLDKLLFFALVNPPKKWKDNVAVKRAYYNKLNGAFFSDESVARTKELSLSILKLCYHLNIKYEDLPVIVYTNSLDVITL